MLHAVAAIIFSKTVRRGYEMPGLMRRDSLRRRADVDMRAGGRSGDRPANGYERNALRGEITDQRLSFGAVGMHGDIYSLAVIEAQLVVCRRLAERADRKRFCEF